MQSKIFYSFLKSYIGKIGIASSHHGIVFIDIGIKENAFLKKLKQKFPGYKLVKSEKKNSKAIKELNFYLKGNLKVFKSSMVLEGTPFQLNVLRSVWKIPYGKMCSYKFIAREVGKPTAVRAVGNVVANNPIPLFIPCHRVIKSDGNLGQYGPGEDIKRKLLQLEKAI